MAASSVGPSASHVAFSPPSALAPPSHFDTDQSSSLSDVAQFKTPQMIATPDENGYWCGDTWGGPLDGNKLKTSVCFGAYCQDVSRRPLFCQKSGPCDHLPPPDKYMVYSNQGPAAARGLNRDGGAGGWWGGGGGSGGGGGGGGGNGGGKGGGKGGGTSWKNMPALAAASQTGGKQSATSSLAQLAAMKKPKPAAT